MVDESDEGETGKTSENSYKELSPQERNNTLHQFYEYIPPPLDLEGKVPEIPESVSLLEKAARLISIMDFFNSRRDSEMKQNLLVKLKQLLDLAPNLSQGFKDFIIYDYGSSFDTGLFERDHNKPDYPEWLKRNADDDPGIFGDDSQRIFQNIELPAYERIRGVWEPQIRGFNEDQKPLERFGIPPNKMPMEDILRKWGESAELHLAAVG